MLAGVPAPPAAAADEREDFEPLLFVAESLETFMADDAATYLNPDDTNGTRDRFTAGVLAAYRVPLPRFERDGDFNAWVLADTTYGVRSSDVDCSQTDPNMSVPAVCEDFDRTNAPEIFEYVIREASTLEGGLGLRLEWQIGDQEAHAYATGRTSFVAVSDQPDDFLEISHWGIGVISIGSKFKNSYLEIGRVKNELYLPSGEARWRADGGLNVPIELGGAKPYFSFFIRTTAEFDRGDGPDSALTSLGFAFHPDVLFGGDEGDSGEEE